MDFKDTRTGKWIITGIIGLVICCVFSHIVIPHHTHASAVCIILGHDVACEHASDCHHKETPCKEDSGDCMLTKALVREAGAEQQLLSVDPVILDLFQGRYGSIRLVSEKIVSAHISVYKPYIYSHYTTFVVPTLGLRAPPLT